MNLLHRRNKEKQWRLRQYMGWEKFVNHRSAGPVTHVQLGLELVPHMTRSDVEWYGFLRDLTDGEVVSRPGALLRVDHLSPLEWLMAADKKKLRQDWHWYSGQLTDKQLTLEDLGVQQQEVFYLGDHHEFHVCISRLTIYPVYLCPKMGMLWLDKRKIAQNSLTQFGKILNGQADGTEATLPPRGSMFLLRRQPGGRHNAQFVDTCGADERFCRPNIRRHNDKCWHLGEPWARIPISSKRIFIDKRLADFRANSGQEYSNDIEWWHDQEPHDPRHWIYETPWQTQRRVAKWARERMKSIRKHKRKLTEREQRVFFRILAGACELQKISLN